MIKTVVISLQTDGLTQTLRVNSTGSIEDQTEISHLKFCLWREYFIDAEFHRSIFFIIYCMVLLL